MQPATAHPNLQARAAQDPVRVWNRLQVLLDGASVGLLHLDAEGHGLDANPAARQMLGREEAELRGCTLADLIHPDDLDRVRELHAELVAGRTDRYELEHRYLRPGGDPVWAITRTSVVEPEPGEQRTGMAVIQDITERKLGELALHQKNARLEGLVEIQRLISAAGSDLQRVMDLVVEHSIALTGGTRAMVSMVEGDELVICAAGGIASEVVGLRRSLEGSLPAYAFAARTVVLVEDTTGDDRLDATVRAHIGDGSRICVPLFSGRTPVAALNVMTVTGEGRLTEEDRQTLELLGGVLGSAISRAAEFEALTRFEATFAGAITGMALMGADSTIVESNAALQSLLGYEAEELRGRPALDLVYEEDRPAARTKAQELMAHERGSARIESRMLRSDGQIVWVSASVSVVPGPGGQGHVTIGVIQDVTQRKLAEDALVAQAELREYQALHDSLTGLPNRTLFRDRVDQAVRASGRSDTRVAVLILDLDRFKEINDALGHAAGDQLLVELGRRLEGVLRASDTVARLGGDEFGILLPEARVPDDVLAAVARIRKVVEEPVTVQDLPLSVEGSIGIALHPSDGAQADALLRAADVAMYRAKEESAAWVFYDATTGTADPARLTLVGELRRALERHELTLYYQPKAALADGTITSVEALLRWNHPKRGLVGPDDFIPLAQQTGLIKPLTLYVIDEAVRQAHAWQSQGRRLSVAVNLSTRSLLDREFPGQVAAALARRGVRPGLLECEITESAMMADPQRTREILESLSAMGIRLSIDDFGTGHSSLSYLKRLPVSEIKIDRSFVMNMDHDEDDATIVRSTIDLAHNLGLEVVAEGVETPAIWDRLAHLGCTFAQGYLLSRPVPPDELIAWLSSRP
jgi:diguanylate cyclase (GGDEF)-like protein/PAS domain S-box-containing protein